MFIYFYHLPIIKILINIRSKVIDREKLGKIVSIIKNYDKKKKETITTIVKRILFSLLT